MVKVIMGLKGAGKTKKLIDLVKKAAEEESGNVVCVEKGSAMTYDIPYTVRLIPAANYSFGDIRFLEGFISGLNAGNYDITYIFIDGLLGLAQFNTDGELSAFLDWCEHFSLKENVKFTMTVSADAESASDGIKKYF